MRELVRQSLDGEPEVLSLKEAMSKSRYLWLSMGSILLSILFPVVEWQLLTLSILTGMKWILNSKNEHIIIIERRVYHEGDQS